jgi:hypothetical protein
MKLSKSILIRILIGSLFVFSGSVKLFPIEYFEMQLLAHGITNWLLIVVLARFIIVVEIFTGIMFLLNYNLKSFFTPFAIFLLSLFSLDLIITILLKGFGGNCGCFGQIIEMTPPEALLKNVFLIVLLIYFLKLKPNSNEYNIQALSAVFIIIFVAVFELSPVRSNTVSFVNSNTKNEYEHNNKNYFNSEGNLNNNSVDITDSDEFKNSNVPGRLVDVKPKIIDPDIAAYLTKFVASPVLFNGNKKISLNDGEKILAVLDMECNSCKETAKKLVSLTKESRFSEIYLLLYGSQKEVPSFIKKTNFNFDYKIIGDDVFFSLISGSPPAVFLLKDGKPVYAWNFETFNLQSVKNKL